jgi:CheY-like chemotaxis protein
VRKVLVVESDPVARNITVAGLTAAGFQTLGVEDSDKALGLLNADRNWTLLFTDIDMPGTVDGWHLGRVAKLLIPRLRVIYVSGFEHDMPELSREERLLTKPFEFEAVRSALRSLGL